MGRRAKGAVPEYRLHKASGQAVVTVGGRQVYLGLHGSEASRIAYNRAIGGVEPVLADFLRHAARYYRRSDGSPTTEFREFAIVAGEVRDRVALLADVGPGLMRELREHWLDRGLKRQTVNQRLGRVPRIFRWAAGEGLCEPGIALALSMAPGVPQNRSRAPEATRVAPVPPDALYATLQALDGPWADAARFQLLTGARPGETLSLRVEQVERRAGYGVYRCAGKMAYRNRPRSIVVPAAAFEIIDRRVRWSGGAFPGRTPGTHLSVSGYAHAVQRAARGQGAAPWHPHQLRHNWATAQRAAGMRVEDVQAALGHAHLSTTEIYAERDIDRLGGLLGGYRCSGI